MKFGVPKEVFEGEARVALTPDSAKQIQKLGYDVVVETGAGQRAGFSDADYKEAGVEVVKTAAALWKASDIVAKVRQPDTTELKRLRKEQTLISFFNLRGTKQAWRRPRKRAPMSSRWKWCRVFRVPRKWMPCRPWPISRATVP